MQGLQLAIKHAAGRPGPACVLLRRNAVLDEVVRTLRPTLFPTAGYLKGSPQPAAAEDVEQALQVLLRAERPVIIAGNGVHGESIQRAAGAGRVLGRASGLECKRQEHYSGGSSLAVGLMGTFGQKAAK